MKIWFAFFALVLSTSASAFDVQARVTCVAVFEARILALFEGTNAESARMSSRVSYEEFEAKDSSLILAQIQANFYVKYPQNKGEVAELAGGRYVYDTKTYTCESISIGEFVELKK